MFNIGEAVCSEKYVAFLITLATGYALCCEKCVVLFSCCKHDSQCKHWSTVTLTTHCPQGGLCRRSQQHHRRTAKMLKPKMLQRLQ